MKASLPEKNNKDLRITEALLWVCSLRDCKKINHNKEERVSHEVEEAFRGCR